MKIKSLKLKIVLFILPIMICSMVALTLISYNNAKALVNKEIENEMYGKLNTSVESIQKSLIKHGQIPVVLAQTVQSSGNVLNNDNYVSLLKGAVSTNKDTFASGIWFEPYKHNKDVRLFAPFAYRDGDKITYTEEYSTEEYNYPDQDWYKIGMNTKKVLEWSEPYLDEISKITMVTATSPFYDGNGNFLGVTTADIDLSSLQKLIQSSKVGNSGKAFLVDSNGLYIADEDSSKIMKVKIENDSNKSLAEIGKNIMSTGQGQASFMEGKEKFRVYHASIPETNWVIGLTISEEELYAPVRLLMTKLLTAISIIIAFIIGIILIFANYITVSARKVNNIALSISEGDLTQNIKIDSSDELGQMGNHLNKMSLNLKKTVIDLSQSSSEITNTSKELAISSEQTELAAEQISLNVQNIAMGAEKQNIIINDVIKSVSTIFESMEIVFQKVQAIAASSEQTYNKAQYGNTVVSKVTEQMKNIHNRVYMVSEIVDILNQKSSSIGQIVSTITNISQQTNLLALNAAIEAARAGEQGKGFAVVSGEVRKLAEQSGEAANQVDRLIQEIQGEIENIVNAMQHGMIAVDDGIKIVGSAGETFCNISDAVGNISGQIQDVSDVTQRISESSKDTVQSIEDVAEISGRFACDAQTVAASSEEQAALMEEVSKIVKGLSDMSIKLDEIVLSFKV